MSEQSQIVWRIVGLTVERVRKFQARTSWEFRAPDGTPLDAIIFAGPNGCGKSSLLDAILFGLSDPRSSIGVEELDEQAEVQLELELWEKIDGDYTQKIGNHSVKSSPESKTINEEIEKLKIKIKLLKNPRNPTDIKIRNSLEQKLAELAMTDLNLRNPDLKKITISRNIETTQTLNKKTDTNNPKIDHLSKNTDYLSAWRSPKQRGSVRPNLNASLMIDDERDRLMRIKSQLVTHLARGMLSRQPEALAARQSGERWLEQITEFWRAFAAAAYSQGVTIGVDEVWTDGELAYDLFVFDGDTRIPVDHLSAGELEILQLAGTLIMRPEGPLQLLIYDEPELHLHQAWQAAWLGAVRALTPQTQLIVATHSEAIWQRAMSYERFLLVDEDDPRASLDAHKRGRRA